MGLIWTWPNLNIGPTSAKHCPKATSNYGQHRANKQHVPCGCCPKATLFLYMAETQAEELGHHQSPKQLTHHISPIILPINACRSTFHHFISIYYIFLCPHKPSDCCRALPSIVPILAAILAACSELPGGSWATSKTMLTTVDSWGPIGVPEMKHKLSDILKRQVAVRLSIMQLSVKQSQLSGKLRSNVDQEGISINKCSTAHIQTYPNQLLQGCLSTISHSQFQAVS